MSAKFLNDRKEVFYFVLRHTLALETDQVGKIEIFVTDMRPDYLGEGRFHGAQIIAGKKTALKENLIALIQCDVNKLVKQSS